MIKIFTEKSKNLFKVLVLCIFLIFILSFIETVVASTDITTDNNYISGISKNNPSISVIDSKNIDFKLINTTSKNMETHDELNSGCCSVVLHASNSSFAYGFRRDHTYSADMNIQKVKLNGKEAIKTYKLTNGYFTHAVVVEGGWFIGIGGWDDSKVNKNLEKLGGKIASKGKITNNDLKTALQYLKIRGMGHFVIKSPDGNIGVVIYNKGNKGSTIRTVFKMKEGEYVSVPNGPSYYRKGKYTVKKSNIVDAAIYIAGTDKWGFNRRNIIVYDVKKSVNATNVKIWATNDDGKYVKRSSKKWADNIIYNRTKTKASSLPVIPNKKYIGEAILK
ncbi:MAG: hypothetical protein FWH29_01695 [Methanobrevibacter sp.]|nr:hypothetical protein [Methanobrevibacter sp.]